MLKNVSKKLHEYKQDKEEKKKRDKKKHLGLKKKSSNSQGVQCGSVYRS